MMNIFKVRISIITYLVIILFLFSGFKNDLFILFIIFIVHELGHLFFINLFKVKLLSLEIYPFGGVIKIDSLINFSLIKQFFIAAGGLIFQLILYFVNDLIIKSNLINYYNSMFFVLNILPIIPFDGSKIFEIILSNFISYYLSLILNLLFNLVSLLVLVYYFYISKSFNIVLLTISIIFFVKYISVINYKYNRFLLERYLYNFHFKKYKFYKKINLKKLLINKEGYFLENYWINEKEILHKKFDNCSYIW